MALESVHELEFRDISGWPGYRVSRDGTRVQSCKRTGYGNTLTDTWKDMKIRDDATRGYKCLGLKNNDRRTWIPVHVLVLTAWVGPRPDGMFACHNNGNRLDNRLENLRWDTQKENVNDSIKHGTWTHGERYGGAKLTDGKVAEMYRLLMTGLRVREVAEILGVKKHTLDNVIRGAWKHVPRPEGFDEYWNDSARRTNEARRRQKKFVCWKCGTEFGLSESQIRQRRTGKYCSLACYRAREINKERQGDPCEV